ncbi:MAG: DinB family protein [Chitinophagales bacterium]
MKQYRDNGAIGALLDEYEKTIIDLQKVIRPISNEYLVEIVDPNTDDPDCKSIHTILTHVVRSGYGYAVTIRRFLGEKISIELPKVDSIEGFEIALNDMFRYNEKLFEDYPNISLYEHDNDKKILVSWGQRFDVEQLFEHAIVHVLRHRRQIERFLIKLSN